MTQKKLRVIVASKNPVKIEAVRQGLLGLGISAFDITGFNAPSEVSDQPMTDIETFSGARNRATYLKNNFHEADLWIGIEGGIQLREEKPEAFAWVFIHWYDGTGQARSTSFQLPEKVHKLIQMGYELGTASDITFGEESSKQKTGTVGLLTRNAVTRTLLYSQAVQLALIPYLNKHLFDT